MSNDQDALIEVPSQHYVPSGRVNLLRLVPLLAAGLAVSAVMAFLLLVAEYWFYLYVITPLALGLPVFGMAWAAVRLGRCRNPGIGGFAGVLLAFVYYAGYWELSYLAGVVAQGPGAVAIVEQVGGMPGLPGYFVFRCKTSRPERVGQPAGNANLPPGTIHLAFNGLLFGVEAVLVTAIAVGVGRGTASRVYSERLRRWAAAANYIIPAHAAGEAAEAILTGDWATVAAMPRVPPGAAGQAPVANLTLDYIPGARDEPAYVTLRAGREGPPELVRRMIPSDQMDDLARALRDLDFGPTREPESSLASRSPTALEESLSRLGLASTPDLEIVEPERRARGKEDFRARAVAASLVLLGDRPVPRLATVDASLCLPASEYGARRLRRASWAFMAWTFIPPAGMLGSLFGCLGLSLLAKGDGPDTPLSNALAAAGIVGFLVAAVLGLVHGSRGLQSWRGYLARRVGGRPGSPLDQTDEPPSAALAIEDGETFHKPKLLGDDFAIVFFDREHRRLIVEGLTHRYVIRAEDVSRIQLVPATGSAAVHIDWSVGEERLTLVLADMNIWLQIPLSGRMARRAAEAHFRRVAEPLVCEPPAL